MRYLEKQKLSSKARVLMLAISIMLITVPALADGPSVGETAPDFSSLSTTGHYFRLSAAGGAPVLLSFWSDWCSSERMELDFLKRVSDMYPEAVITIVNSGTESPDIQSLARIARSMAQWNIKAKILVDKKLEVTWLYSVESLPTSILIDPGGRIVYRQPGFFNGDVDKLNSALDRSQSVSQLRLDRGF